MMMMMRWKTCSPVVRWLVRLVSLLFDTFLYRSFSHFAPFHSRSISVRWFDTQYQSFAIMGRLFKWRRPTRRLQMHFTATQDFPSCNYFNFKYLKVTLIIAIGYYLNTWNCFTLVPFISPPCPFSLWFSALLGIFCLAERSRPLELRHTNTNTAEKKEK